MLLCLEENIFITCSKQKKSLAPNNSNFISCKQAVKRTAVFYCSLWVTELSLWVKSWRFQQEWRNNSVLVEDEDKTILTTLGAALLMMDVLLLMRWTQTCRMIREMEREPIWEVYVDALHGRVHRQNSFELAITGTVVRVVLENRSKDRKWMEVGTGEGKMS